MKFKITKEQLKDIGIRMLKTALEVALATITGSLIISAVTNVDELKMMLYNVGITVGSAVATALINIILKLVRNIIDDRKLTAEDIDNAFGGGE